MVRRILLVVAYDGTGYHGWQLQKNAVTIEEKLNQALGELTGEMVQVIGASRTDAGVHALGNAAVFDTESRIPGEKFAYALNTRLPDDIVIQHAREVPLDFHPRHTNCRKTYEYAILNRRMPLPEYRNYAMFCYGSLNLESMREAAQYFIGEHDFAAFCSAGAVVETTVREIYAMTVEKDGERILIRVTGNGFLYHMVRIIVGTLLEVGRGKLPPSEVEGIIASRSREKAGPTAQARGLRLVEIVFPDLLQDQKDHPIQQKLP